MLIATWTRVKHIRKFSSPENVFPGFKVFSYWLIEVWSIDLLDMQQISRENLGVRYLFVAVNTLICFLWVVGVKSKISKACSEALKKLFQLISNEMLQKLVQPKKIPNRYRHIKAKNLLLNLQNVAKRIVKKFTLQDTRRNLLILLWLRNT